ncbi:hypothetical protein [Streptomyces chartreusis]|uniref:hypothetical protein n=1 Tax=Streptomyces chartreusis TaxID=1969 RepID=UPI0033FAAA08
MDDGPNATGRRAALLRGQAGRRVIPPGERFALNQEESGGTMSGPIHSDDE